MDNDHIANVPFPAYKTGQLFRDALSWHWLPALDTFRRRWCWSAGFDVHASEDMSQMMMTNHDFAWFGRQLIRIMKTHADNRLVSELEGGQEKKRVGDKRESFIHVNGSRLSPTPFMMLTQPGCADCYVFSRSVSRADKLDTNTARFVAHHVLCRARSQLFR